ncbi:hypothetical protein [Paracoccus marcusii]|uniref:hypothetical protein n=1 Tax=Paracoccus marcusii TaxID=59779 RepID=UPI001C3CED49|nr:hypothetical protein [Paracoccus marcusii]
MASLAAADADLVWPRSVSARQLDGMAPASGLAETTETPLSNGARASMIAARCRKTRFRSNESRKRFLAVHQALATYLAGRDHA